MPCNESTALGRRDDVPATTYPNRSVGRWGAGAYALTNQANRRPATRAKPRWRGVRVEREVRRPHAGCTAVRVLEQS